jgi:hypothetical protein
MPKPEMFCQKCGCPLAGLDRPLCPKCGRAFDPGKPRTFLRQRPTGLRWYGWMVVGWNLLVLAVVAKYFILVADGYRYALQHPDDRDGIGLVAYGMFVVAVVYFVPLFLLSTLPTVFLQRTYPRLLRRERALVTIPWLMILFLTFSGLIGAVVFGKVF